MSRATPSLGVTASAGLLLHGLLLTVLTLAVGLGAAGWLVAVLSAGILTAAMVIGPRREGGDRPSPADLVTYGRGLMVCAVAGLSADGLLGLEVTAPILALTVPALVLDAVDGRVARRTGTATDFGARFDGEVDAFLILVLSVVVAGSLGWWVLAAGLVRYGFAVAGWVLPWMRGRLEPRPWRKVVTASVGILLTVAVADVLPRELTLAGVLLALALLAESFGRDVWWLWRHRPPRRESRRADGEVALLVRIGAVTATVVAVVLLWLPLAAPARPDHLDGGALLRLPLEVVVLAGIALAASSASARVARWVSLVLGSVVGVVAVVKLLDITTFAIIGRPFNLALDRDHLGHGVTWARLALGTWATRGIVAGGVLLLVLLLMAFPWAVRRLIATLRRHSRNGRRLLAAAAGVWLTCAALGVQVVSGVPVAAADTSRYLVGKVDEALSAQGDLDAFELTCSSDPLSTSADVDLSALAGKDVVIVFVESLGRVALEAPEADDVRDAFRDGQIRLGDFGYQAASAYLTSPTFGGSSWLAHSTFQSGVTVSDQSRYDRLLKSPRATLSSIFQREGWRTVAILPGSRGEWPEGEAFFRFDELYDGSDLGYAGPRFGFSIPDQFALAAFGDLELDEPGRPRVLAQIELTSSHAPWAPLPTIVDAADLGDGSVYQGIKADAVTAAELWRDRSRVPGAYRASIVYSLESILSFLDQRRDDDLVVIMLGDHQPSTIVSGFGSDHDVPVSILSRDRAVLDRIAGWGWDDGLAPGPDAPLWQMADFRDRFLQAYGGVDLGTDAPSQVAAP